MLNLLKTFIFPRICPAQYHPHKIHGPTAHWPGKDNPMCATVSNTVYMKRSIQLHEQKIITNFRNATVYYQRKLKIYRASHTLDR